MWKEGNTPKIETSTWPPRIIPNDSLLSKVDAPETNVTVSFPALMMSLFFCQLRVLGLEGGEHSRIDFVFGGIWSHAQQSILRLYPDLHILWQE